MKYATTMASRSKKSIHIDTSIQHHTMTITSLRRTPCSLQTTQTRPKLRNRTVSGQHNCGFCGDVISTDCVDRMSTLCAFVLQSQPNTTKHNASRHRMLLAIHQPVSSYLPRLGKPGACLVIMICKPEIAEDGCQIHRPRGI